MSGPIHDNVQTTEINLSKIDVGTVNCNKLNFPLSFCSGIHSCASPRTDCDRTRSADEALNPSSDSQMGSNNLLSSGVQLTDEGIMLHCRGSQVLYHAP